MVVLKHDWGELTRVIIVDVKTKSSVQIEICKRSLDAHGNHAFLFDLWVDKDRRDEGIGMSLLAKAEEVTKELCQKSITLEHWADESPMWVRAWYLRRGYRIIGRKDNRVLMVKEL